MALSLRPSCEDLKTRAGDRIVPVYKAMAMALSAIELCQQSPNEDQRGNADKWKLLLRQLVALLPSDNTIAGFETLVFDYGLSTSGRLHMSGSYRAVDADGLDGADVLYTIRVWPDFVTDFNTLVSTKTKGMSGWDIEDIASHIEQTFDAPLRQPFNIDQALRGEL